MSGGAALRAAWEAAQKPAPGDGLRAAFDAAQKAPTGIHAEYASGNLAKRMQRENENDAEAAADGEPTSTLGAFGHSLAATGANIAQGIPGMEAVEAGARALVRRQPYREALGDIRGETSKIPTALRVGEKIAGAAPLAGVLPGSPAASGAIIGGADQLLSADPDESKTGRAVRTVAGAAGGALAGKATDAAITGVRAMLPTAFGGVEKPAASLLRQQAERAASARDMYGAAIAEGRGHEATPAIQQYLADPDIQEIVSSLQQTHQFANTSPESPEMLDAIYKTLSDQAKQAQRGLNAVNPSKANQGRFRLSDIKAKQQGLLRAMGAPGEKPPLTLDVAPEVHEVAPRITPEREPMAGPINPGLARDVTSAPSDPTLRQALRDFPQSSLPPQVQGPQGPAFQLGRQPRVVQPGVRIETPAMRVQTAPAQQIPAMMPTYQHAVEDYAKRTSKIEATKRGYDALRSSLAKNLPTADNLTRKTPEAFAEWAGKAAPADVTAARQGVLGAAKMATGFSINPMNIARPSLKAAELLRSAAMPEQQWIEALQNLGLLTAGNATTP